MLSNTLALFAVAIGGLGVYGAVHFVRDRAEEHDGPFWGLIAVVAVTLMLGLHLLLTHGVAETAIQVTEQSGH